MLTRAFELLHERIDDLALLMTLEMGKPLAEARGEIAYAAEFFRHFAGEAVRIDGYQTAPAGGARFLVGSAAGRSVLADHAVELPDGDGHPQTRPRDRGRLHERDQAGPPNAAVDARADGHPDRGGCAGRCGQLHHRDGRGTGDGAVDPVGLARKLSFTGSTRPAGCCSSSARRRSCGPRSNSEATRR